MAIIALGYMNATKNQGLLLEMAIKVNFQLMLTQVGFLKQVTSVFQSLELLFSMEMDLYFSRVFHKEA